MEKLLKEKLANDTLRRAREYVGFGLSLEEREVCHGKQ